MPLLLRKNPGLMLMAPPELHERFEGIPRAVDFTLPQVLGFWVRV
jgi:hypothetical protein